MPDRVEPSFVILTSGHSDAQGWSSECPDVKNYKWRLNLVWHRMLYSCCAQIATVDVKGFKFFDTVKSGISITWVLRASNYVPLTVLTNRGRCRRGFAEYRRSGLRLPSVLQWRQRTLSSCTAWAGPTWHGPGVPPTPSSEVSSSPVSTKHAHHQTAAVAVTVNTA